MVIVRAENHNHTPTIAQQRRYAADVEIAEIYRISVRTLRRWRLFGRGPRWYKVGRCVRYDVDEVEQYVRSTGSTHAEAR
jgi:hypothetical protein